MKKVSNRIEEHMTAYPAIASRDTSVSEAFIFMLEMGFRHLPVVEDGKVVGIISERDLRQVSLFKDLVEVKISEVMTRDTYCVQVGTPLSVVAKEMAQNKYGSTVILNAQEQVVGILTTTDGMRILSEILEAEHAPAMKHWGIERLLSGSVCVTM